MIPSGVETIEVLRIVVLLAVVACAVMWFLPAPCKCDQCAFHTNERRMAHLKRAEEVEDQRAKAAVLRHDQVHKGSYLLEGEPDRFDCESKTCPRNRGRGGTLLP